MQIFLAFIPLVACFCIFIFLHHRHPEDPIRRVVLNAVVWYGCYLVFWLEVLSIFKLVTQASLVMIWGVPIIAFIGWWWRKKAVGQQLTFPSIRFPHTWWDWLLLLVICCVLVTTALVAWISPPQTWDSLTYHLSRVAHWAQDRSIWHFATGSDRQTSMPPGAEEHILNFYIMTQGDRLSNFPEWFAMLGSLVGVSLIAYYLGAKTSGQLLAAGFAATIPMGIVQASSSITDYVATFWVICAIAEVMAYHKSDENRSLVYISLATGSAILTKPTVIPFLIPFICWLGYLLIKRHGLAITSKWGVSAILMTGIINVGYLARNVVTYGALSNPIDFTNHYNQLHSLQALVVTVLKNIGMQVGLPGLDKLNNAWFVMILKISVKLGLDINDPRMTALGHFHVSAPSNYEDAASNPYHAYLIFILFVLMFFLVKKHGKPFLVYGLLAASTFVLFSFIFKWNAFGTRYDLAFFVLFSPMAGIILGGFDKFKPGTLIVGLLFVGSFPWLFSIVSRPLIAHPEGIPGQISILKDSRQDLYFANAPEQRAAYIQFTDLIKNAGCSDIGLMLHGEDPEYLIWVMMGAPDASLNIQWIIRGPTDKYSQPGFKPCAIICHGCTTDQTPIRGLVIARQMSELWLYLPPEK
jgi:hypothetical protein